jgi:rhamnogalacturonyl hydrolase YesR
MTTQLDSPIGRYEPELLFLAPESGEDLNTLSLVSQFLELGVPIELDAQWRLPVAPPKPLSKYKACLFPETAKAKYDADLDRFYKRGGYVGYFKYYPVTAGPGISGVHHYYESYGRDLYAYTLANVMLEGGLTVGDRGFARLLERRSVGSMIAEYRAQFFARYGKRNIERWGNWGDPAYTQFLSNIVLAEKLKDAEWLDLVSYCLGKLSDAAGDAMAQKFSETKALVDTPDIDLPMMGSVLMERGTITGNAAWIESGVTLTKRFAEGNARIQGVISPVYMRFFWSETLLPLPALYWVHRLTGDKRYRRFADTIIRTVAERNQLPSGLWRHWTDPRARSKKGACWSRGTSWPLIFMTEALKALDPGSESAEFIRRRIAKTFQALRKYQDRRSGIWHLVMDEPETRIESSASTAFVYCYDQLRELDALDSRHADMIERAFLGLKRLWYRGGISATCRGTATGVDEYYRTRPIGYYHCSLFPAALATRR